MASLREQLLEWYNKIPYNSELDSVNLNFEIVEVMIQSEELRTLFSYAPSWGLQDLEKLALILKKYRFVAWEVFKIIETYSPTTWDNEKEAIEQRINEIMNTPNEQETDVFNIDFNLYPFRVSKNGIEVLNNNKDIEDYDVISETPIVISATGVNLDDETFLYQCTYRNVIGDYNTKWVLPSDILSSDIKKLANLGLHINSNDSKYLLTYFKKMVKYVRWMPKEYTALRTGWKKDCAIFIIGNNSYSADGKRDIIPIDEVMGEMYTQKGNRDEWIKIIAPMLDYDITRIKCYSVVAAMILKIIDAPSFILHQYFESSGSKTLTTKIALSLIGNPELLCRSANSTDIGIEQTAIQNTDVVLAFDETTRNPQFRQNVYNLVNGVSRNRGTIKNNEVRAANVVTWRNVTISTGEYPLTQSDSSATGEMVRILEIFDGVPKIDENRIREIEETVRSHYGFFLDDIIEVIISYQKILKNRYNVIRDKFEVASTPFAARKKNYYAALTLGGQILENVLMKYQIPHKNAFEICKKYYISTVINDETIPYYIRALDAVYSWHVRNRRSFEYSNKLDPYSTTTAKGIEIKGWVTAAGVIYDEGALRKYLGSINQNFDRAIKEWDKEGILTKRTDGKTKKYCTTVNGQTARGYYIKFEKIYDVLKIKKKDIEIEEDLNKQECEDIEELKGSKENSRVNLKRICEGFIVERPDLNNVTRTSEEVAKEFIKTDDGKDCSFHYGFQEIGRAHV